MCVEGCADLVKEDEDQVGGRWGGWLPVADLLKDVLGVFANFVVGVKNEVDEGGVVVGELEGFCWCVDEEKLLEEIAEVLGDLKMGEIKGGFGSNFAVLVCWFCRSCLVPGSVMFL